MLSAVTLSLGDLADRAVLRVLAKSLAITLAVFAVLGGALWWWIDGAIAGWDWHGALAGVAATLATVLALWLLFRVVAIAVVGLFADEIVAAIERRHYPAALATARPVPVARAAAMGLASAGRALVANLLAAPLYLVLLVTGVGTALAFLVVNGWLLGRDLGDMVAARHLTRAQFRDWRRANRLPLFVLGLAAAALFVVPFLNILAPILGATMATHLFHQSNTQ